MHQNENENKIHCMYIASRPMPTANVVTVIENQPDTSVLQSKPTNSLIVYIEKHWKLWVKVCSLQAYEKSVHLPREQSSVEHNVPPRGGF